MGSNATAAPWNQPIFATYFCHLSFWNSGQDKLAICRLDLKYAGGFGRAGGPRQAVLELVTSGRELTGTAVPGGLACHPAEQGTLPAVLARGGQRRSALLVEPGTWQKETINTEGHNWVQGKNRACLAGSPVSNAALRCRCALGDCTRCTLGKWFLAWPSDTGLGLFFQG